MAYVSPIREIAETTLPAPMKNRTKQENMVIFSNFRYITFNGSFIRKWGFTPKGGEYEAFLY